MAEDKNTANPFLNPAEAKSAQSAVPFIRPRSAFGTGNNANSPANSPQPETTFTKEAMATLPRPAVNTQPSSAPPKPIEMAGPKFGETRFTPSAEAPSFLRRYWLRITSVVIAVLLIALGVYWWWQTPVEKADDVAQTSSTTPTAPLTTVTTEAVPPALADDTASYRSENFKVGEIVFLGEAQFLADDEGIAPLTLEGIRGEAFTEKNKQEVKLVITWKTNKLSSAEIAYAKGIGQTPKMVNDDDYSYNHSVILTGLDPASTYLYTIKAIDRFGNVVTSEPYAVFTGARSVSLFDLIAGAIGEVFGWAVK